MLPADAESKATGDLYQWELSIAAVDISIPLASLDDEDAVAARTAPPELCVEFGGTIIRTGYTTPPLTTKLVGLEKTRKAAAAGAEGGGTSADGTSTGDDASTNSAASLRATFAHKIDIPLTDLAQRLGPQRIGLSHLVMQVVASFGHRRVIVGGCVLAMTDAISDPGAARQLELRNCGVNGGGSLDFQATLTDRGSRAQQLLSAPTHGLGRKSTERSFLPKGRKTGGSAAETGVERPSTDKPIGGGFASKWKASKKKLMVARNLRLDDETSARVRDSSVASGPESVCASLRDACSGRSDAYGLAEQGVLGESHPARPPSTISEGRESELSSARRTMPPSARGSVQVGNAPAVGNSLCSSSV